MARLNDLGAEATAANGMARGAARQATPWVERGARLGYAAKGAVYILIGILALQAAAGSGGQTADKRGALTALTDEPAGAFALGVIALGLFGYALWRVIEAATDAEGHGSDAKGMSVRAAHAFYGLVYGALALEAARLAGGGGGSGGGDAPADWTARVLAWPAGRWLVIAAGLGIVGYGVGQLVRAYTADVRRHLDLGGVDPGTQEWIVRLGRLGYAARGVVFGVIGWFLVRAAWRYDAGQAGGLGEALGALEGAPYGPWLLGLVAAGLVAYGLFQVVHARYRVIRAA